MEKRTLFKTVFVFFFALAILQGCGNTTDPLPPEIREIKLGASSAQVVDMIKDKGEYSKEPLPKRSDAAQITWTPRMSTTYKKIEFIISEKDRLYMIRFILADAMRWKVKPIKEAFFNKFGISWEFPGRIKIGEQDAIVYTPKEDTGYFFFELKNPKTGDKTFEVFSRQISGKDRPNKDKVSKQDEKQEKESSTKEKPLPVEKGPASPPPQPRAEQQPSPDTEKK